MFDLEPAIVRILSPTGAPSGAGCLVRDHYVVTCAHVVAAALGLAETHEALPTQEVTLDFPFLRSARLTASVVTWWPYRLPIPSDGRCDVAVLQLSEPPPETEPARLSKPGHQASGKVWVYGIPEDAGMSDSGDWFGCRTAPPRPDRWRKLMGTNDPTRFIEPGCSGGPVILEEGELVLGIVSLRQTQRRELKEAYGISADLLRQALPRPPRAKVAAALTVSVDPAVADLHAVLGELLQAAAKMREVPNVANQVADEILAIGQMLRHCLEQGLSVERLADLATHNEDLADFAQRAHREEFDDFFEETPLRAIVDRLDEVTSQVPTSLSTDDDILIDHTDPTRADTETILKLLEEVQATQAQLESDQHHLDAARRDEAWRGLQALKVLLNRPRLSLRRVNEARHRLETIRANLLDRTVRLTRVLLGHHAALLPTGAVFQDHEDAPPMVVIPAGSFVMGSPDGEDGRDDDEGPQRRVTIAQRLAVGRYPVTFEEYDRFADATGREQPPDEGWGRGRRPVINVHWTDAGPTWRGSESRPASHIGS